MIKAYAKVCHKERKFVTKLQKWAKILGILC